MSLLPVLSSMGGGRTYAPAINGKSIFEFGILCQWLNWSVRKFELRLTLRSHIFFEKFCKVRNTRHEELKRHISFIDANCLCLVALIPHMWLILGIWDISCAWSRSECRLGHNLSWEKSSCIYLSKDGNFLGQICFKIDLFNLITLPAEAANTHFSWYQFRTNLAGGIYFLEVNPDKSSTLHHDKAQKE